MDFLKSFIFPLKMRRFRNMSGLIAVGIFLILMYLAIVPIRVRYSKADYVISKDGYSSKGLYYATSTFDYKEIKAKNYIIDTEKQVLTAGVKGLSIYQVNTVFEDKNVIYYFVFDLEKDTYNKDEDLYALYQINKSDNSYVFLFSLNYYELENVQVDEASGDKKSNILVAATYKGCKIDFNSYNNTDEFLDGVAYALAILYGETYVSSFTFTSALMLFLLPCLLVAVMWLVLRKNGTMKRFKEYYNIAAISSIIPALIAFGIAWFWPQVINFYTTVFVMYYLFVVYRINAFPDDYEEKKATPIKKQSKPIEVEAETVSEDFQEVKLSEEDSKDK